MDHTGFVQPIMLPPDAKRFPLSNVVTAVATVTYVMTRGFGEVSDTVQQQASTTTLIALIMTATWVLATVARPYQWWRVTLVVAAGLAYVVIFSLPFARRLFMLDPSNLAMTATAVGIGLAAAVGIEVLWWLQGRILGERRRLWR